MSLRSHGRSNGHSCSWFGVVRSVGHVHFGSTGTRATSSPSHGGTSTESRRRGVYSSSRRSLAACSSFASRFSPRVTGSLTPRAFQTMCLFVVPCDERQPVGSRCDGKMRFEPMSPRRARMRRARPMLSRWYCRPSDRRSASRTTLSVCQHCPPKEATCAPIFACRYVTPGVPRKARAATCAARSCEPPVKAPLWGSTEANRAKAEADVRPSMARRQRVFSWYMAVGRAFGRGSPRRNRYRRCDASPQLHGRRRTRDGSCC